MLGSSALGRSFQFRKLLPIDIECLFQSAKNAIEQAVEKVFIAVESFSSDGYDESDLFQFERQRHELVDCVQSSHIANSLAMCSVQVDPKLESFRIRYILQMGKCLDLPRIELTNSVVGIRGYFLSTHYFVRTEASDLVETPRL